MIAWFVVPGVAVDVINLSRGYSHAMFHVEQTERVALQVRKANSTPSSIVWVGPAPTRDVVCTFALLLTD
jgi:hypothetical protein